MSHSVHPHVFGFGGSGSSQAWSVLAAAPGASALGDRVPWPQQAYDDPDPAMLFGPLRAMRTQTAIDAIHRACRGSGNSILASYRGALRLNAERGKTPRVATLSLLFNADSFAAVGGFPDVLFWLDGSGSLPQSLDPELAFPEGGWFERLSTIAIRGFQSSSVGPVRLSPVVIPDERGFRQRCVHLLHSEIERLSTLLMTEAGDKGLRDQLTGMFQALKVAHRRRATVVLPADVVEGASLVRLAFLSLPYADRTRIAASDEVEAVPPFEKSSAADWSLARVAGLETSAGPPSWISIRQVPVDDSSRTGALGLAEAVCRGGNDLSRLLSLTNQRASLIEGDDLKAILDRIRWKTNWGAAPSLRLAGELFTLERGSRGPRARLSAVGLVMAEALRHEYGLCAAESATNQALEVLRRISSNARQPILRGLVRRLLTKGSAWDRRTAALIRCRAALDDSPLASLTELDRLRSASWERSLLTMIADEPTTSVMLFEACTRWAGTGDEKALAMLPLLLQSPVSASERVRVLEGITLDHPATQRWTVSILGAFDRASTQLPYDRLLADWLLPETERLARQTDLVQLLRTAPWLRSAALTLHPDDLGRYLDHVDPPLVAVGELIRALPDRTLATASLQLLVAHACRSQQRLDWVQEWIGRSDVVDAIAALLVPRPDPRYQQPRLGLASYFVRWFGDAQSVTGSDRVEVCLELLRSMSRYCDPERSHFTAEVRALLRSGLILLATADRLDGLEASDLGALVAQIDTSDARHILELLAEHTRGDRAEPISFAVAKSTALSALRSFAQPTTPAPVRSTRSHDGAYAVWFSSRFGGGWTLLDQLEMIDPTGSGRLEDEWLHGEVPISLWLELRRRRRDKDRRPELLVDAGSLFFVGSRRPRAWTNSQDRV